MKKLYLYVTIFKDVCFSKFGIYFSGILFVWGIFRDRMCRHYLGCTVVVSEQEGLLMILF